MDSVTQIVLGGAVAAAIAPPAHRRAALLAGAALGTLPDLDTLPIALMGLDPVAQMTLHRGLSHSLLVLPWIAAGIWYGFWRFGKGRVAHAPQRWFWAIQLALLTHPVLDAFTIYGTQLWWPLTVPPTMWGSVFIIDPGYTLWLLLACALAWIWPNWRWNGRLLIAGLLLSSSYLGWSLWAKYRVEQQVRADLLTLGLDQAPYVAVPLPFTTLLWRVVVMTPDGYLLGDHSLWADRGAIHFVPFPSDIPALTAVSDFPAVQKLAWFNQGFMRAQVVDNEAGTQLVISDLRMGLEPDYNFNFTVAVKDASGVWQAITPQQPISAYRPPVELSQFGRALAKLGKRINHQETTLFTFEN